MTLEAGQTLSHYLLVDKLGEGGMGVVWRARDLRLDRDVAVKVLPEGLADDPTRRALLEREAKAVAALRHPNIVTIHAVAEAEGVLFFTMELLDGDPLSALIVPGGIPFDRFLKIAVPLADAIAAAHESGIIHRDLKTRNVMIGRSDAVKVLDFGLAQVLTPLPALPGKEDETHTLGGGVTGTLRYMSPEQLRGEALDHRTDIFSLGIILFELATGEHPFGADTAPQVMASILKGQPRSAVDINPRLPRELDRLLLRCLEKDASLRISSAASLRNELEKLGLETGGARVGEIPSVAVLPFADMSRDKDQAYFCEGIAEEIINALCRLSGLRVASRTASFLFGGSPAEPREIGRRLGVETILEGSVRKSGNRLRITAQLAETSQGFHLWSESFDRELKDVFEIQEEIARSIVRALQVTLSPQEKGALRTSPTRHVQAFDYYLRGRSFYYRYGKRDIEFALQLFKRATELDPGYAVAYAGLADCWSHIYLYSERRDSVRQQAEEASRTAVELAPDSAQAQASRAVTLSLGGAAEEAGQAFEKAIRLDPGLFEAWYFYARHTFGAGDLPRAAKYYQEAIRVRPDDYQSPLLVAQIYDDLKQPDNARESRRKGVALVEERLELYPDDARALYMGANGLVALGEREKGLEWARRARTIAPDDAMLLYNLGCIYSLAGEIDEAIDCLEKGVASGQTQKAWFEHDSNLDPLRGDRRFKALMEKL
jgi:serine/threonine protein kinase/cytochrome c-type biogenesis protein CcmH/NrfG